MFSHLSTKKCYFALIMLACVLTSTIVSETHRLASWSLQCGLCAVIALLHLIMQGCTPSTEHNKLNLWHCVLCWSGLVLCHLILQLFINNGTLLIHQASLLSMLLLGLTLFILGIVSDLFYLLVGIMLCLLAAVITQFSWPWIVVPMGSGIGIIAWIISKKSR